MSTSSILRRALLVAIGGAVFLQAEEQRIDAELGKLPPLEQGQLVLATKLVRMGKDTLTYKRVTPPAPSLSPAKEEPTLLTASPLLAEVVDSDRDFRYFCCSIVPYPSGVSEIQWTDEEGRQKRVFVHDDLTYLGFSFGLSVDNRYYDYTTLNYGGYGNTPLSEFPPDIQRYVAKTLSVARGQFFQVPSATDKLIPLSEIEADVIDVMLAYYQINRDALKEAQEKAIAQSEVEAEAKRIRDLKPKSMEVRMWPVTSQRYSTAK